MRNILHDYPDDKCATILRNTAAALGHDSRILVDEMVLPNTGTHWEAAQLDMVMMTCLAARERTRGQWEKLVDEAGLRIVETHRYTENLGDSILVLVPKEGHA